MREKLDGVVLATVACPLWIASHRYKIQATEIRALGGLRKIYMQNQPQSKMTTWQKIQRVGSALFRTYPKTWPYIREENPTPDVTIEEDLRKLDVDERNIVLFNEILSVLNKASHDLKATQRFYQYVLGGIGVFNLVLFQMLASAGRSDTALSVSWLAFVISLPCTVGALFLSKEYGKIKNLWFPFIYWFIFNLAFFGCGLSITAFIWHYWDLAGRVFAVLAVITYLVCMFYESISRIRQVTQAQANEVKQQQVSDNSI